MAGDASENLSIRLGSVPAGSREGIRFLQQRVAFFGRIGFLLCGGFYLVINLARSYQPAFNPREFIDAHGNAWHIVATALLLCQWLIARGRPLSRRALEVLDAAVPILLGAAFARTADVIPEGAGALDAMLAITNTAVSRAVLVPSTARRTLWISTGITLPLVVAVTLHAPPGAAAGDLFSAVLRVVVALLWGGIAVTVATVASHVIYGLGERVREARQLGQYTLEEPLGQGGMGVVYRARHAMLRRPTAIKLLCGAVSEARLRRFEREVQLTAMLTHPNTIVIYDYGRTPDGVFYYVMEYLEGVDLEKLVARHGPQPAARVIRILRQVCSSLAEAHGAGLLHRDIKPANIFLCSRGGQPDIVKVLDFGLATEVPHAADPALSGDRVLTGTPLYMSPESIRAPDDIDARSDLYAVGAVGYWLLTGRTVFEARSSVEVCYHHLHTPPDPPSKYAPGAVPPDLERVLLDCLAKDADGRPPDALTLEDRLASCVSAPAWSDADARRWWKTHARAHETQRRTGHPPRTLDVDLQDRIAAAVSPSRTAR